MENVAIGIMVLYALGAVIVLSAIVYFIFKRIKDKEKEDFEKRDN